MEKKEMPKPQVLKEEPVVDKKYEEMPAKKEAGIQVRATREGFYNTRRIEEGDVFMIENMNKLGSWMEITDSKLEAERQAKEKQAKKAMLKSGK